jgi:NADH-quinone oxidoreductase subunit M
MASFLSQWILTILIAVPVVGAIVLGLAGRQGDDVANRSRVARLAFGCSLVALAVAVLALVLFYHPSVGEPAARAGNFALVKNVPWVSDADTGDGRGRGGYVDFRYHVGVDGLSIWLVLLTAFITPLSIWGSFTGIRERVRDYYVLMLLLEAGMLGVFCARDLLLFYIFFEFTLIPLFFIIGIWGGAERRRAAGKFFLYTFTGSMLTFAGVLYLAYQAYVLPASRGGVGVFTFDLEKLYGLQLSYDAQWWLFLALAVGFAVKVPLFPLHTWLPLAHTEAPTAGSVLLAAILLKLGTYGFLRFNVPLFPAATVAFAPAMAVLGIIGIIYAALIAWVQHDVKKLVAYSSVSHLGFCILGMFTLKTAGVSGSLLYMINHGLSTGALFLIVGMIYERYHTREFNQLGGLARPMPWLAFFLIVFTLSSIGLPGLNGFVAEFLVLVGTFTSHTATVGSPAGPLGVGYGIFAAIGIILSAVYMLYMCQRLLFGPLCQPPHTPDTSQGLTRDLTGREIGILTPIALACLVIGVFPNLMLDTIRPAAERQVLARVFGREEAIVRATPERDGPANSDPVERRADGVIERWSDGGMEGGKDRGMLTRWNGRKGIAAAEVANFGASASARSRGAAKECSPWRKPWDLAAAETQSPGGAKEPSPVNSFAPPGLSNTLSYANPRLTPWATFLRPSGAGLGRCASSLSEVSTALSGDVIGAVMEAAQ